MATSKEDFSKKPLSKYIGSTLQVIEGSVSKVRSGHPLAVGDVFKVISISGTYYIGINPTTGGSFSIYSYECQPYMLTASEIDDLVKEHKNKIRKLEQFKEYLEETGVTTVDQEDVNIWMVMKTMEDKTMTKAQKIELIKEGIVLV